MWIMSLFQWHFFVVPWESSRMWEENPIMWQLGLYFHINCLSDVKNVTILHIPGQTSLIMNIFIAGKNTQIVPIYGLIFWSIIS